MYYIIIFAAVLEVMETNLKNFVSVSVSRMVRETVILNNRKNVSRCHWKGKKGYGIIK